MKIKNGYILQEVAGNILALPTDGEMNKMITLNETAKFLWERMEQETDRQTLIQALLSAYEVEEETAALCVDNFVAELEKYGFLA